MVASHGFSTGPIALPDNDTISLAEAQGDIPTWYQPPRIAPGRPPPRTYKAALIEFVDGSYARYRKMSILQRCLLFAIILCIIFGLILVLVLHEQIGSMNKKVFNWLVASAKKRRESSLGWMLPLFAIIVTSLPPTIGHGTCTTFAGLMYGTGKGWLIVASGNIIGAAICYWLCRGYLRAYMERQIAKDKRLAAFSLVLKHDGLKLICAIRLCPIPYSLMNGSIATFPSVTLLNHTLATAIVTPMSLIGCFIGSRLASLSQEGDEMATWVKALNIFSIVFGFAIGITTGVLVYRKTKARAAELEAEERETGELDPTSPSTSEYMDDISDEETGR